jgi:hypothetical protein
LGIVNRHKLNAGWGELVSLRYSGHTQRGKHHQGETNSKEEWLSTRYRYKEDDGETQYVDEDE